MTENEPKESNLHPYAAILAQMAAQTKGVLQTVTAERDRCRDLRERQALWKKVQATEGMIDALEHGALCIANTRGSRAQALLFALLVARLTQPAEGELRDLFNGYVSAEPSNRMVSCPLCAGEGHIKHYHRSLGMTMDVEERPCLVCEGNKEGVPLDLAQFCQKLDAIFNMHVADVALSMQPRQG